MSRSPLAYPLNRSADTDAGGAADLQTDIMRFMAILSMCLLAIFALVQSIPLAPVEKLEPPMPAANEPIEMTPEAIVPAALPPPEVDQERSDKAVVLTRPQLIPRYTPTRESAVTDVAPPDTREPVQQVKPITVVDPPEDVGFTLRFASDAALMRAVAAQHVALYAIERGRARRMTVSDSRISFWDASTPSAFHEMEASTVPRPVIQALDRAGADSEIVSWGVTLPGRMKAQLDELLGNHQGGSLIITAGGDIHWEAS